MSWATWIYYLYNGCNILMYIILRCSSVYVKELQDLGAKKVCTVCSYA